MAIIRARIDESLRQQFEARAAAEGHTVSEQLRIVVVAYVARPAETAPVETDAANSELRKVTVRLPAFLRDAALKRATSSGMTMSRWIAALVQSNLLRKPVMTDSELEVLQRTNYV